MSNCCHLSVPQKKKYTLLTHSLSCHNWGNKAKTLHSHTYPGPHAIHSPGTSGAIFRSSQCPPALLPREGDMQSESMKFHVHAYSALNSFSAGSARKSRCFFKFSQMFFEFWSHFPPLSYGKSFAATYQPHTNILREREVEGIFRYI